MIMFNRHKKNSISWKEGISSSRFMLHSKDKLKKKLQNYTVQLFYFGKIVPNTYFPNCFRSRPWLGKTIGCFFYSSIMLFIRFHFHSEGPKSSSRHCFIISKLKQKIDLYFAESVISLKQFFIPISIRGCMVFPLLREGQISFSFVGLYTDLNLYMGCKLFANNYAVINSINSQTIKTI